MRVSAALLLLLSLLGGLLAVPALADEEPAVTSKVDGRLVLVLDSSGSMKETAAGGGTKIEAAKQALTDVVDSLPDDAEVGMRVFGEMAKPDRNTRFAAPVRIEVELVGEVSGTPELDEPEAESSPSASPAAAAGDKADDANDSGASGFLLPALGLLAVLAGVVGLGWWAMRRRTPRG